jgi:hypothetical protein
MMKEQFTQKQINNWHEYEFVRQEGSYNMFDPRARRATGLSGEEYSFCMKHYSELREAANILTEKSK